MVYLVLDINLRPSDGVQGLAGWWHWLHLSRHIHGDCYVWRHNQFEKALIFTTKNIKIYRLFSHNDKLSHSFAGSTIVLLIPPS